MRQQTNFITPFPLRLQSYHSLKLKAPSRSRRCPTSCNNNQRRQRSKFQTALNTLSPKRLSKTVVSMIVNKIRRMLTKPEPKTKPEEWLDLIEEYEYRTNKRFSKDKNKVTNIYETLTKDKKIPLNSPRHKHINPDVYKTTSIIETSFMGCITFILWYLGRIYRFDSFLILFYPLPTMYIAARWGVTFADRTTVIACVLMTCKMGPLQAFFYILNDGLLTMTYSRYLWYQWSWTKGLLLATLAKTTGVIMAFLWMGTIIKHNPWVILNAQISAMLATVIDALGKVIPYFKNVLVPLHVIQICVFILIFLVCVYHVFCTFVIGTLILLRIKERAELTREPRDLPLLRKLFKKAIPLPTDDIDINNS